MREASRSRRRRHKRKQQRHDCEADEEIRDAHAEDSMPTRESADSCEPTNRMRRKWSGRFGRVRATRRQRARRMPTRYARWHGQQRRYTRSALPRMGLAAHKRHAWKVAARVHRCAVLSRVLVRSKSGRHHSHAHVCPAMDRLVLATNQSRSVRSGHPHSINLNRKGRNGMPGQYFATADDSRI